MAIIIIKLLHHVQDCGNDNGFLMIVVPMVIIPQMQQQPSHLPTCAVAMDHKPSQVSIIKVSDALTVIHYTAGISV